MNVIKKLSTKVEQDHSRQLQDIRNIEDNTKKFMEGGKDNDNDKIPVDFEKLVGTSGGMINSNTRNSTGNGIEIPPDPFDTPGNNNSVAEFMTTLGSSNMVCVSLFRNIFPSEYFYNKFLIYIY